MSDTILIQNRSSSLLPNGVYSKQFKSDLFSYGRQNAIVDELVIFEDQITDEIINIWGIEKRDLADLKKNYSFTKLNHSSSIFIKECISIEKDGLFFNHSTTSMEVVVIDNGTIHMYTSLFGSNSHDLLYYVLLYQDRFGKDKALFLSETFDLESTNLLSEYVQSFQKIESQSITIVDTYNNRNFKVLK